MKYARSFVTGSRIYGTVHDESDIDLVVLITEEDRDRLAEFQDYWAIGGGSVDEAEEEQAINDIRGGKLPGEQAPNGLVFGRLNIIPCIHPELYEAWLDARDACTAEKPVTKKRAIQIHEMFRSRAISEIKARLAKPSRPVAKIKKPVYVPKQGGPVNSLRNYCSRCKQSPCICNNLKPKKVLPPPG